MLHQDEIDRFVAHRIPTGSCVRAILANDLMEAFGRADDRTAVEMKSIVTYIYNKIPGACWGSYGKVDAWLREGSSHTGYSDPICPECDEPIHTNESTGVRCCGCE